MMPPGRKYINSTLTLRAEFTDDAGTLTDPDTLTLSLLSPNGARFTYTYESDDELAREDEGQFACSFIPRASGRWFFRWEGTGTAATVAKEGNFMIDYSPYIEDGGTEYGSDVAGQPTTTVVEDRWTGADW